MRRKSKSDLQEILCRAVGPFETLAKKKILIFGGTGFIGQWIVETISAANRELNLEIDVQVVTRDVDSAFLKFSGCELNGVTFVEWDIGNVPPPEMIDPHYIIFGATSSISASGANNVGQIETSTLMGMEYICNVIIKSQTLKSVINLSSGAVYGRATPESKPFKEGDSMEDLELTNYGRTKLISEQMLSKTAIQNGIGYTNARLFAFFGPGLALNEHFAIGNFVRDALSGNTVRVNGSPETVRSYMYPTDLVVAIFYLLTHPVQGAINVGHPAEVKIGQLAKKISDAMGTGVIETNGSHSQISFYVPDISKLLGILGDITFVDLDEGLTRWKAWI